MRLKTDDLFFLLGLVLVCVFIVLKYEVQHLVELVLGHKFVSVADDKLSDRISNHPLPPKEDPS